MLSRAVLCISPTGQRKRFQHLLSNLGAQVVIVSDRGQLWAAVKGECSDLLVIGRSLLPKPWETTVASIRKLPDQPEIIVTVEKDAPQDRASFLGLGIQTVLAQTWSDEVLENALKGVIERRQQWLHQVLQVQQKHQPKLTDFESANPSMQELLRIAHRVAPSDSSVLLLGETGVGKERLAKAIHQSGPRAQEPFVAINCGALSESLAESELFGHEQGAFTGALRARRGCFELAHQGTLFLDEVGELPLPMQVKLLRAIQEKTFLRVGSEAPISVDARVIAATNRDLHADVRAGRFRADLYYRLAVVSLTIPPLRARREDIPALIESSIAHFRSRLPSSVARVSPEALTALLGYDWPGNVRELSNVIERAMILCHGEEIGLEDLPIAIAHHLPDEALQEHLPMVLQRALPLLEQWLTLPWKDVQREAMTCLERAYLDALLKQCQGRIDETARRAGIQARSLFEKMKKHGLRKEDYKQRKK